MPGFDARLGNRRRSRDVKFDEGIGEPQRVIVEVSDGEGEENESVTAESDVKADSEGDEEGNSSDEPSNENPTSPPADAKDDVDTEADPETIPQPPPLREPLTRQKRASKWPTEPVRRSTRITRAPVPDDHPKFSVGSRKGKDAALSVGDAVGDEHAYAVSYDPDYWEKIKSPNASLWIDAMNTEMDAQRKMETYEEVAPPADANILDCRWVFAEKRGPDGEILLHKARIVAKGFKQVPGVDFNETYAPTMHKASLRTLLALAAYYDMEIHQMDVKAAFLHGELKETIYMRPPNGFPTKTPGHVWLLKKSLYGLKQAARAWHQKAHDELTKMGFIPTSSDPSVYIKLTPGKLPAIVGTHVDDSLQIVKGVSALSELKARLASTFEMKDLGEARWFLGLEITRDRPRRTITLSQERYTLDILNRFGMAESHSVSTPMAASTRLEKLDAPSDSTTLQLYQQMLGCLMYAMVCTRPDLAYAVGALSQHSATPGPDHLVAMKRAYRYLSGTRGATLVFDGSIKNQKLVGYSDSDWAGDPIDRRSIAGHAFLIGNTAISWSSKKQQTVALSSTEGEYMSTTMATCEAIFLRRLCNELGFEQSATTIFVDNQSAMDLARNPVHHSRTKHIEVRHHFIREKLESGEVTLEYKPTADQTADIFTKPLPAVKFLKFRDDLGIVASPIR